MFWVFFMFVLVNRKYFSATPDFKVSEVIFDQKHSYLHLDICVEIRSWEFMLYLIFL